MKSSLMCYMCSAQLYKVHRLKLQCLKAEELLTQIRNQLLANSDGVQRESIEIDGTEITPFTCTAVQCINIEPFPNVKDTIRIKYEEDVMDVKTEINREEGADEMNKSEDNTDLIKATITHSDEVTASKCSIETKTLIPREGVTDREKHKHNNIEKSETKYCQWTGASEFRSQDEYIDSTRSENKTQFICYICMKYYKSKTTLKHHIRLHSGERPYSCEICDKRFMIIRALKIHERIHTGERPYSCKMCDKRFTQKGALKTHENIHTGEKLYSCKICDKRFTQKSALKRHERILTGERRYSCKICDERFTKMCHLKIHERLQHIVTHSDDVTTSKGSVETKTLIPQEGVTDSEEHKHSNIEKSETKYCQWSGASEFRSNDEYINRTRSENETQFICDICKKNYKSKSTLKRHIRIHTDERPYSCKICDKRFRNMINLKNHERLHTGERPYRCEICDMRFTIICTLKRHIRIHTGERPYSCKICDKRFTGKNDLKRHELLHTDEKPYSCKICDKRFTRMSYLKKHVRVHTGERPYICKMCDKRFTRTHHLKTHRCNIMH